MSCSGRFVRPFLRVLSQYPGVSERTLAWLREQSETRRVAVSDCFDTLADLVRESGDDALGLSAGALFRFGEAGALDFAMHSASSLRSGVGVARRHARLWSDAFDPRLELAADRALVRLDGKLPWPRAVGDFMVSIWHANYIRVHLPEPAPVEAWFAHSAPPGIAAYERAFAGTLLRFDAPCYGVAFARELLDAPLLGADAALHAAQCQHLDFLQTRLSEPPSFSLQVRELMAAELRRGRPTAQAIAQRLQMSRRTLVRRLHGEGTTFKVQLDQLRRELALNLVVHPEFRLNEISAYLRFSHIQAFHRAFRRWTGRAPAQFRERAQDAS